MSKVIKHRQIDPVTPFDRILKAWLKDDLNSLSETDANILERITEVDKRYRKGYSMKVKVYGESGGSSKQTVKRPYRMKELAEWNAQRFDISLRQAYQDVKDAQKFFLFNEGPQDKEFARGAQIQWGEELMAKAAHNGDYRAAAAFFKEVNLLKGLDKFEDAVFDPSRFEPINPIIVTDASEIGFEVMENPAAVVAELIKSFKQNVLDKMLDDAEEVEFDEEGETDA